VESPFPTPATGIRFGLWSGDFNRMTGQAIVTTRAANLLRRTSAREFVYRGTGLVMLQTWLMASVLVWWYACTGRLETLYLVGSRSTPGFLRDLPAYLVGLIGVRVVVHLHGSDIVSLLQRRGVGGIARRMLQRCELILPSHHLVKPLQDLGLPCLHVCENFVAERGAGDAINESPMPRAKSATLNVLWNSNVMASKGFFILADAVATMHREGKAVKMLALGSAMADEQCSLGECQRRLATLALEPWFKHRGMVDRATSMRLLVDSDVVCLPSTYSSECQPLALIEAMCAKRRLVIANTAALRATVQDYPCETVDVATADAVRAAFQRLEQSNTSEQAMMSAAAEARERFSAPRFDREFALILCIPGAATAAPVSVS
jgi:glycosyltransferase involved in cell wall biosynthesis